MATNAIVDSIIFKGSLAGQTTVESQGLGGNLTFQLPNVPPIVGQLINVLALNGQTVVLGFASPNSSVSTSDLDDVEGNGTKVQLTNGSAAPSPVITQLGVAANYAVLAAAGITNTGSTVVAGGNIGSFPTTTITGFPPGAFVAPAAVDNAGAAAAQTAALAAYNFYSALTFTSLGGAVDLSTSGVAGSNRYIPGNYSAASSMAMSTGIVLDAQGVASSVFVFKAGSTVNLASNQSVTFINGADPANLVWIVGSSFTSVAPSTMAGNILANTSITLGGGVLNGRALAGIVTVSGAVTISTATNITASRGAGVIAAGDVVIYDAFGNVMSSGILLSSLGGAAGVLSFNGRSGAVSPQSGDYSYAQISGIAAGVDAEIDSHIGVKNAANGFAGLDGSSHINNSVIANGSITVAQVNSKEGTGTKFQMTNQGATTNNDVVIYDSAGNTEDSGILLSSLASTASLAAYALLAGATFTGAVAVNNTFRALGNGARGLYVGLAPGPTDGTFIWDDTGANAFTVGLSAGGIKLETSGTGNVAVSASGVTGTNGNLALNAAVHFTASTDVRGTLTVTNPATSATFTFTRAFALAPVVVVVPQSNPVGDFISYWVTSTTTDFTVHVNTTPATSAIFNYHVIG